MINKIDPRKFKAEIKPNWCPKCGDYSLLSATTKVLSESGYEPNEVVIISGIGCSSSFPHWTTSYGMHVLHGRALPAALGVHSVNPDLKIIVVGGDGDGYGIGVGHLVHTARRDIDITYLVMNNQIYGLTLGQSSPSSQKGHITLTAPQGVIEPPINPIALALSSGASFVGRGYSGNSKHLQDLVGEAINHKGFSFVDTLSPCVTFNKLNTYSWFNERVYQLNNHDATDLVSAYEKGIEWGDKIPIGIFYKNERNLNHNPVNYSNQSLILDELGIKSDQIFKEFR